MAVDMTAFWRPRLQNCATTHDHALGGQSAARHSRRSDVPAGVALFPKDLALPPREWAERSLRVERWTEMPRGGHFAAMEEPDLLVEDLRAFFRPLRGAL